MLRDETGGRREGADKSRESESSSRDWNVSGVRDQKGSDMDRAGRFHHCRGAVKTPFRYLGIRLNLSIEHLKSREQYPTGRPRRCTT